MVNFYHRFVPGAAQIMQPLYSAVSGKAKHLTWTEETFVAFYKSKHTHNLTNNNGAIWTDSPRQH